MQKTQIPTPETQTLQPDQTFIITGPTTLSGHVSISGSKNSSLPLLAATLLCKNSCLLHNVPIKLTDIKAMVSILRSLGAEVKINVQNNDILVNSDCVGSVQPCSEELKKTRGGFFVIGPLLGRFGKAVVALPGGCDIGERPVDLYVRGLRALGAVDGKVLAHAANGRGLVGGSFHLDFPSVGATETLMMAASMADGDTLLSNVAKVCISGCNFFIFTF
ncbi:UDP-N-acetylglucosamine 1-carboxyvinyltransferase [Melia azedarach]|uniref:UDP-N-acetylglucosamine 1-carboxyvinyltransferase n=1 Tax=Melia azedarach TaxID=155640 RepID=A0ACC1YSU8_MELAZ|nr:UDP-N-acetylglucosamine 1-carboxyvinyltransferase [Melia azedarach]